MGDTLLWVGVGVVGALVSVTVVLLSMRRRTKRAATDRTRIPAYHEAGHVVLAVASRFHSLPAGHVGVEDAFGEALVSLSRSKLWAGGQAEDLSAALAHPEVARDAAVVFLGGFAAEVRYCEQVGIEPDPALSRNDARMARAVLDRAGANTPLPDVEAEATNRVAELWPVITAFAEELHRLRSIDTVDALDSITPRLPK